MQDGRSTPPDASALERLPHLARQICGLWGTEELEAQLNGLIMDSRDGRRQGFPLEVVDELLFLVELVIAKRAHYAAETTGMPFRQAFRLHLEKSRKFTAYRPEDGTDPWSERDRRAPVTDPWSDPRERREPGRATAHGDQEAMPAPLPQYVKRTQKKRSWWRRLVG